MALIKVKDSYGVDVYLIPELITKLKDENGSTRIYYNDEEEFSFNMSPEKFIKKVFDDDIIEEKQNEKRGFRILDQTDISSEGTENLED